MANQNQYVTEEEMAAQIAAEQAAANDPYSSFAAATNQLAQQGVTVAPPTFEEATQALVQQGMPAEPQYVPTTTPMLSPDAADPYANVAGALMALQKPAPLAPTGSYSQDEIGKQMQAEMPREGTTETQNLNMAQQAPEAFDAMIGSMAGTGLQANMPTPLAPAVAPDKLEPVPQDAVMQVAAEQAQADMVAQQARQRQIAQEQALLQAQHEAAIQKSADDKLAEQDARAAGLDLGSIVGQGLAVAMGEYGRYLTGGKENLGVAAIDRALAEKARKEKMSAEEKAAAKQYALQEAQLKLREEELKTDSQLKRAQIAKIGAEIQQEQDKVAAQRRIMALVQSGRGFGAEDLQMLPEAMQEKAVLLPNGQYGIAAVNKERLNEGQKAITANTQAKTSLKQLMDLTDYFGNNPGKKVMSREQIAAAQTLAQSLKGQLRLSLLGPGAITDYEHEMLNNIIRDPTKIASLASANRAALQVIMNKVNSENNYQYRSLGINLPPTVNERNVEAYKKAYGLTDSQAIERLTKMGKWEN